MTSRPGGNRATKVLGGTLARTAEALAVLFVLASLVFFALRVLPGDPALLVLGDEATPEELATVRARLHTDEPMAAQYVRFVRGLFTLDLGESIRRPGTPAMARVTSALGPTSELAFLSVALGAVLGVIAAMAAAGPWLGRRRRWIERGLVGASASPLLAFAPLATWLLAVRVRLVPLPGDPDAGFAGLLFASLLLSVPLAAQVGRTGRAALGEIEHAQFLTAARAKGASSLRVWLVHALPVVTGPLVTVIATELGALLGGAVVLERLFERAGLGTLILESYASRDLPVLEGAVIAAGALFVGAQAVAAAVHGAVDPRVRA